MEVIFGLAHGHMLVVRQRLTLHLHLLHLVTSLLHAGRIICNLSVLRARIRAVNDALSLVSG